MSCRNGSTWRWTYGASTITPQKPTITLGIAASISTIGPTITDTARGAIMASHSAIAIPSGTASTSAIAEVTNVP